MKWAGKGEGKRKVEEWVRGREEGGQRTREEEEEKEGRKQKHLDVIVLFDLEVNNCGDRGLTRVRKLY